MLEREGINQIVETFTQICKGVQFIEKDRCL